MKEITTEKIENLGFSDLIELKNAVQGKIILLEDERDFYRGVNLEKYNECDLKIKNSDVVKILKILDERIQQFIISVLKKPKQKASVDLDCVSNVCTIRIDGHELYSKCDDTAAILNQLLEFLGYEVDVTLKDSISGMDTITDIGTGKITND